MVLHVINERVDLKPEPNPSAKTDTQLLYGECVRPLGQRGAWCEVENTRDGYRGWVPNTSLAEQRSPATHAVHVPRTFGFDSPDIKRPPRQALPLGAELSGVFMDGWFLSVDGLHVPAAHVLALETLAVPPRQAAQEMLNFACDFFHGSPYLWGGRSVCGLDCSGLVQLSAWRCGVRLPRDSTPQRECGQLLTVSDESVRIGDLLFWPGHVAMQSGEDEVFHANAHSMDARRETLSALIKRLEGERPLRRRVIERG